jgi:pimeloyl-ACP methyl ester carboxylesterase
VRVELGGARAPLVRLDCDRAIPTSIPEETRTVRIVDVGSRLLSEFHGRPVRLRALVHLPEAWFAEPERRFPAFVVISGFGASLAGFESVAWPAAPIDGEPFVTVYPDPSCEFGHSAFHDSAVNGPWEAALVEELLPEIQRRFRCIDHREARIVAGHSSGAWSALWLIARRPDVFGAAWASSPDPVDFRDFMGVDLYAEDANLLVDEQGRPRPFCTLGGWAVNYTYEHARREEVLRGGVLAFFEALLGPRGPDGGPVPLFDRETGRIDPAVAAHWRRHDLSLYLRERWDELGPLLDGRLVLTVGDKDNFLLHGSVELLRRELAGVGADVDVHVLSGDHFSQLVGPPSAELAHAFVERFRAWRREP